MKICFIMGTPFTIGGEQRVVSILANMLQKRGYQVTIICKDSKTPINYNLYHLDKDIEIKFTRKRNFFEKILRGFNLILININNLTGIFKNNTFILQNIICDNASKKLLEEIIQKEKYDVIIGVNGEYSLFTSIIKCHEKVKRIGWQHNSFDAYFRNKRRKYWNQEKLYQKLLSNLHTYIVLTDYDKNKIKEEWNMDCKVIYNPKSFEVKDKAKLNEKNFLAIGRLIYAKGFDNLVKSFKIFSEKNKDWNLKIVGEGEEYENLINLIKKYNLDKRIKIYSYTNNIQKYFLSSSVLLMSSRWEGMPMIMIEALEMGVPIIAYDIPVVKELIENKNVGIVVKQGNIEEFAHAMELVANNHNYVKKLGKNTKKITNIFSCDEFLNKWELILNKKY